MKRMLCAAALVAAAMLAVAAAASADVPRYQAATLTVTLTDYGYVHTYNLLMCGDSFTGTGGIASLGLHETIAGTLSGTTLHFRADYLDYNTGYHYTEADYRITWTVTGLVRNHGDFVSHGGDPHSQIGMPCR